jgi:hypothetical protein
MGVIFCFVAIFALLTVLGLMAYWVDHIEGPMHETPDQQPQQRPADRDIGE